MNKIVQPTYLSNEKESLIVSSTDIEGVHGIPLGINYILYQLQRDIKAFKLCCGDNYILDNVTPQVFTPIFKECQWKGEWAWYQNKKVTHGVNNLSSLSNNSSKKSDPILAVI